MERRQRSGWYDMNLLDWVSKVGVPAALAVFLVYFLTHKVAVDVSAMRSEHLEMRFYLRGICLNVSDTEVKRLNCIPRDEGR